MSKGKTVTMEALTKAQAEALVLEIREGLLNVERTFTEFIAGKGWVALGYVSFQECWMDRFRDIRLATDAMRATVVYALLDEGRDDDEIVRTTAGKIRDEAVRGLRRQKAHGVPPHRASTRVRSHERKLPSAPYVWSVTITSDEREHWKSVIEAHGHNTVEWTTRILRREVGRLEQG